MDSKPDPATSVPARLVRPAALGTGSRIPVQYGISDPSPTFRGAWIQMENGGQVYGVFEDGADRVIGSQSALSTTGFTPLGITWDATTRIGRIYFRGLDEGSVTTQSAVVYATTNLETGRHPQFAARFWQGDIDEVAMWNVLLSPNEMATVAWLSLTGQSMKSWIGL